MTGGTTSPAERCQVWIRSHHLLLGQAVWLITTKTIRRRFRHYLVLYWSGRYRSQPAVTSDTSLCSFWKENFRSGGSWGKSEISCWRSKEGNDWNRGSVGSSAQELGSRCHSGAIPKSRGTCTLSSGYGVGAAGLQTLLPRLELLSCYSFLDFALSW